MSQEKINSSENFYTDMALSIDNKVLQYRYESIKPFFTGNSCLELGPADGVMTQYLRNDFKTLDIVDGSEKLLDLIPDYPNVNKHRSLFEDFRPEDKYPTIIMEHVLEHIENPVEVLRRVKEWLLPDGVLIIGVPNANSIHRLAAVKMGLLESEYQLNDRDKALGHYRVYDMNTLENDVNSAGLKVLDKGGVFIKPISNSQINATWTNEMIDAFYLLGKDLPNLTAEIYVVCSI